VLGVLDFTPFRSVLAFQNEILEDWSAIERILEEERMIQIYIGHSSQLSPKIKTETGRTSADRPIASVQIGCTEVPPVSVVIFGSL
jgi:hypothetical protein